MCNTRRNVKRLDYNLIKWENYFYYDLENGVLRWLNGNKASGGKNKRFADDTVGSILYNKNGKPRGLSVMVEKKLYLVHRIIWCILYGSIDSRLVIDHKNGNCLDNSFENLRLVTTNINNKNIFLRKDSKTKTTGVYRCSNGKGNFYYAAIWNDLDSCQKVKYFNIEKLGEVKAFELAKEFRLMKINELNLLGAGYSEGHGVEEWD